jgi:telomere length regulation protein
LPIFISLTGVRYIRDLIPALRDTENVERHHLAITTAPSLIRRKIGFGSELAEQIEELALTIVGLQNDNKHPSFHESRLQSVIALIVSQPLKMGRWFTAIYFDGDLSQVQRSAVLTALGLSARELAGNGEADAKALRLPSTDDTSFPSKRLSPALEAMYSGTNESPVAMLTRELSRTSLEPLAATAADTMTGPNALKVRTFSSRMEVEKKRKKRDAQRQNSTAKDLHKVLAEGFFFPLQGRFEIMMLQFSSYVITPSRLHKFILTSPRSSTPSYNPFFIPHLLTLFLQTLSLILSTAGPHTPFLPALTHEALSLLLPLHTAAASSEPTVTAALLSLFLAVVDLNIGSGSNGEERLVTEYATQVIELREWASQVFDRTPPSTARTDPSSAVTDPQEQIRTLAAGVMVRLGEVMQRYQGRLMGVHSGFDY